MSEKKKWIAFSLRTNFTVIPIKEEEFCILLGNLLDNAIEAAEKCEPGRRRIALEISGVNGMFLLHMENTSAQKPVVKNGKLRSSKEEEGHGFGMENMRRIVENYGGIFRWEYTEQEFRTEILLEGEEKNEQR